MRHTILRCCMIAAVVLVAGSSALWACTSFVVSAEDGSVVVGRSMEFAADLGSRLVYAPRGEKHSGSLPTEEQECPGHQNMPRSIWTGSGSMLCQME